MKTQYIFTVSLVLILLAMMAACNQASFARPETSESNQAEKVAPQKEEMPITVERAIEIDSNFYAANPELMAAGRSNIAVKANIDSPNTDPLQKDRTLLLRDGKENGGYLLLGR